MASISSSSNGTATQAMVSLAGRYDGLLSAETANTATLTFNIINVVISVFGVGTNVINIAVFARSGIAANATVASFFALSVSDVTYLLLNLVFLMTRLLSKVVQTPGVPLAYIGITMMSYWHMAYNVSVCITVYIAVQKTCCVAMPLKFKNAFTVTRSVAVIVIIVAVLLAFYVPMMCTLNIVQVRVPGSNLTTYAFAYGPNRKTISLTFDMSMQNILPSATQVIVLVCLLVLVIKLRQASALRKSMSAGEQKTKDPDGTTFSAKDIQVIKAVTTVSLMFVVCNLPPVFVTYATFIEPEFNDFRYYGYLYATVGSMRMTLLIICASVNIFVYFHFNSSYKATLVQFFNINSK